MTGLSRNDFAPVASAAMCNGAKNQENRPEPIITARQPRQGFRARNTRSYPAPRQSSQRPECLVDCAIDLDSVTQCPLAAAKRPLARYADFADPRLTRSGL